MFSSFFQKLTNSGTTKPNQEYNILLLGETGSGKSTTINAFGNYMRYESFEEATRGDFVELIASKFVLSDPNTGDEKVIRSGQDDNELGLNGAVGKSSTRQPRTYRFNYADKVIRLIDTPGIGDTDGTDQDKENFDAILSMLHCFKELHGILILLKSNETRKTAFFQYCIAELLTHLHKSACQNIVVCFTFSRNSFYSAGDGFSVLKDFLKNDLQRVQIDLKPGRNCYFIDNEAYRFLVAQKSGYQFPPNQAATFRESWDKSVEQSTRMFEYITSLPPHDLVNTTSLNSARKLIYEIAEPMVRLQSTIDSNIAHLKDKKDELQNSNKSKFDLAKNLNIHVDDLEQIDLPYPTTVCTANKCIQVVNYQGKDKINYVTRCHEKCQLPGVQTNKVNNPDIQGCAAMNCDGSPCSVCQCGWEVHMHLTCKYEIVKRSIVDTNKQRMVQSVDDAIANINAAIDDMERTVRELEQEMKVIEDIGSKFAYILIEHSNTPYNKFLEPYLDLLINEEKKKIGQVKKYPRDKLDRLEKMKATHIKNVAILTKAIQTKSQKPVELRDIFKYRDELCRLKHTGGQFAQMLKNTQFMTNNNFKVVEKTGVVKANHSASGTGGYSKGGSGPRVTQVTAQTQQRSASPNLNSNPNSDPNSNPNLNPNNHPTQHAPLPFPPTQFSPNSGAPNQHPPPYYNTYWPPPPPNYTGNYAQFDQNPNQAQAPAYYPYSPYAYPPPNFWPSPQGQPPANMSATPAFYPYPPPPNWSPASHGSNPSPSGVPSGQWQQPQPHSSGASPNTPVPMPATHQVNPSSGSGNINNTSTDEETTLSEIRKVLSRLSTSNFK